MARVRATVEEPALLRVWVLFWRGEHQVEERVVGDLGREPVPARANAEYHDVVGLQPLRGVHGPVGKVQARMVPLKRSQVRDQAPVPPEQEDARPAFRLGGLGRNPVERLVQERLGPVPAEADPDARPVHAPDGTHLLHDLRGIAEHEAGGHVAQAVRALERRLQIAARPCAETLLEPSHDGDVRSRETKDRLPVVADHEELGADRLVQERLQQRRSAWRDVLELVDERM